MVYQKQFDYAILTILLGVLLIWAPQVFGKTILSHVVLLILIIMAFCMIWAGIIIIYDTLPQDTIQRIKCFFGRHETVVDPSKIEGYSDGTEIWYGKCVHCQKPISAQVDCKSTREGQI